MKNFLPPPGSLLEARKVHLCVLEGEGIRKSHESQISLGYGTGSASRHLLGLCCFPPAVQQFSHDVLCSSVSANSQEEYLPTWARSKGPRAEETPGTPLLRRPPAQTVTFRIPHRGWSRGGDATPLPSWSAVQPNSFRSFPQLHSTPPQTHRQLV